MGIQKKNIHSQVKNNEVLREGSVLEIERQDIESSSTGKQKMH